MSKITPLLILLSLCSLLALTACGAGDDTAVSNPQPDDLPTLLPTAVMLESESESAAEDPNSPREADNNNGLPPTFTPEPAVVRATPPPNSPGLVIESPSSSGENPPASGETTYTIQAGDTLAVIAADFGVSLDRLIEANDIADPDRIEVGDVLVIPAD